MCIILIVFMLTIPSIGYSITIEVPKDYKTIQAAIDASNNGDTILVSPKTYYENIDFIGKTITVKSTSGATLTTIDGNQTGNVVIFNKNEGKNAVLQGFTITNGSGHIHPTLGLIGGGIYCHNQSSPLIIDNIISSNSVIAPGGYGGGVFIGNASPLIINNEIKYNVVKAYGGGIICWGAGQPVIESNLISKNHGMCGGGIFSSSDSSPIIKSNRITGNSADILGGGIVCYEDVIIDTNIIEDNNSLESGGGIWCAYSVQVINNEIIGNSSFNGGGIYNAHGSPIIKNNIINTNSAKKNGGGLCFSGYACPEVDKNIITHNSAIVSGGGVHCRDHSSPTLNNNIITHNSAIVSGGGVHCKDHSSPTLNNNIIARNNAIDGGGISCGSKESPLVENNNIWNNIAEKGGGIYCSAGFPDIKNNIVVKNMAVEGGGVFLSTYFELNVNGNTISRNSATNGGGAYLSNYQISNISNSIIWGNDASVSSEITVGKQIVTFSNVKGGHLGTGNIDSDPLFIDPDNYDYHLTWRSPCINRGENDSSNIMDIDGDFRPYMGTVDIGADEYVDNHSLHADIFCLSETAGGRVFLSLNGGISNKGRGYIMFGSVSGTNPGVPLSGGNVILPINCDKFAILVINNLNSIYFQDFIGTLGKGTGRALATFNTNGSMPAGIAGIILSFAFALNNPVNFVSNPVSIEILP